MWKCFWAHSCQWVGGGLNSLWPCNDIRVRSRNCGCLVSWFCYQLIAKPGNKTAAVSWPNPLNGSVQNCSISIAKELEILRSCTKPSIWLCRSWSTWIQVTTCCSFVQANNKENIKALHYWPFVRRIHWSQRGGRSYHTVSVSINSGLYVALFTVLYCDIVLFHNYFFA